MVVMLVYRWWGGKKRGVVSRRLFVLAVRRPPKSTRTVALFPNSTLFRSAHPHAIAQPPADERAERAPGRAEQAERQAHHTQRREADLRTDRGQFGQVNPQVKGTGKGHGAIVDEAEQRGADDDQQKGGAGQKQGDRRAQGRRLPGRRATVERKNNDGGTR